RGVPYLRVGRALLSLPVVAGARPAMAGPIRSAAGDDGSGLRASRAPIGMSGPERIVCLTEETTEWLYLLGEERRIVGISGYTVRPRRAREEKPRISSFLDGRIDKIVALQPD